MPPLAGAPRVPPRGARHGADLPTLTFRHREEGDAQLGPAAPPARGLTLVETLVAVGITAVVVGLAVPGMAELRDRQRLRGIAALLETDIHQARSWAVARGRSVRLDFAGAGCWVLHTGPAGDCRCDGAGGAVCGSGTPWRVAEHGDAGVSVVSNSASIAFDPVRGTVTPTATIRVRSRRRRDPHRRQPDGSRPPVHAERPARTAGLLTPRSRGQAATSGSDLTTNGSSARSGDR
ncbi:MAG: GspH/FimT family pseudopilin [Comamonadaceae bacterium]|nr:GspH/FimT family pseudopilin [Comamonadaceae bacterium]